MDIPPAFYIAIKSSYLEQVIHAFFLTVHNFVGCFIPVALTTCSDKALLLSQTWVYLPMYRKNRQLFLPVFVEEEIKNICYGVGGTGIENVTKVF